MDSAVLLILDGLRAVVHPIRHTCVLPGRERLPLSEAIPPHLTVASPAHPDPASDEAGELLARSVAGLSPFRLRFATVRMFAHGTVISHQTRTRPSTSWVHDCTELSKGSAVSDLTMSGISASRAPVGHRSPNDSAAPFKLPRLWSTRYRSGHKPILEPGGNAFTAPCSPRPIGPEPMVLQTSLGAVQSSSCAGVRCRIRLGLVCW